MGETRTALHSWRVEIVELGTIQLCQSPSMRCYCAHTNHDDDDGNMRVLDSTQSYLPGAGSPGLAGNNN